MRVARRKDAADSLISKTGNFEMWSHLLLHAHFFLHHAYELDSLAVYCGNLEKWVQSRQPPHRRLLRPRLVPARSDASYWSGNPAMQWTALGRQYVFGSAV